MGIWNKYGTIIYKPTDDSGTNFGGTSNGDFLYDTNPVLISPNSDGKVFKVWFQVKNDLWYAEANNANGPYTRSAAALLTSFGLAKIYKSGTTYYLYGCSPPTGNPSAIKCYTSPDGVTLTLANATAMSIGGVGKWDNTGIQYLKPFYFDGVTYYATYSGLPGTGGNILGIATSTNLTSWTNGIAPVAPVGGPCPIIVGGTLYVLSSVLPNPGTVAPGCGLVSTTDLAMFGSWTAPRQLFPPTQLNEGSAVPSSEGIGVPVPLEANGQSYIFYTGTNTSTGTKYRIMGATTNVPLSLALPNTGGLVSYQVTTTPVASDDMQRANETPLSDGGKWSTPTSPYVQSNLVSHLAKATSTAAASHALWSGTPTIGNDQYSEIVVGTNSASATWEEGANSREASATLYQFRCYLFSGAYNWDISAIYLGTTRELLQTGVLASIPIGTDLKLVVGNGALFAYLNGVLLSTVFDSTILTGKPSIHLYDATTPSSTGISSWAGGNANVIPNYPSTSSDWMSGELRDFVNKHGLIEETRHGRG